MQRLPDTSLTVALAHGGRQFFGWGTDRALVADTYDALNVNTRATGQWKKGKEPDFPAYPRPQDTPAEGAAKKRVSVKDIYQKFTGRRQ